MTSYDLSKPVAWENGSPPTRPALEPLGNVKGADVWQKTFSDFSKHLEQELKRPDGSKITSEQATDLAYALITDIEVNGRLYPVIRPDRKLSAGEEKALVEEVVRLALNGHNSRFSEKPNIALRFEGEMTVTSDQKPGLFIARAVDPGLSLVLTGIEKTTGVEFDGVRVLPFKHRFPSFGIKQDEQTEYPATIQDLTGFTFENASLVPIETNRTRLRGDQIRNAQQNPANGVRVTKIGNLPLGTTIETSIPVGAIIYAVAGPSGEFRRVNNLEDLNNYYKNLSGDNKSKVQFRYVLSGEQPPEMGSEAEKPRTAVITFDKNAKKEGKNPPPPPPQVIPPQSSGNNSRLP